MSFDQVVDVVAVASGVPGDGLGQVVAITGGLRGLPGPPGGGVNLSGSATWDTIDAIVSPGDGDLWVLSADDVDAPPFAGGVGGLAGEGLVWSDGAWRNVGPIVGPPGPPGPGSTGYRHDQIALSDTWVINHPLGRRVVVQAYSAGSVETPGEVVQSSDNQVTIRFNVAMTGYAELR